MTATDAVDSFGAASGTGNGFWDLLPAGGSQFDWSLEPDFLAGPEAPEYSLPDLFQMALKATNRTGSIDKCDGALAILAAWLVQPAAKCQWKSSVEALAGQADLAFPTRGRLATCQRVIYRCTHRKCPNKIVCDRIGEDWHLDADETIYYLDHKARVLRFYPFVLDKKSMSQNATTSAKASLPEEDQVWLDELNAARVAQGRNAFTFELVLLCFDKLHSCPLVMYATPGTRDTCDVCGRSKDLFKCQKCKACCHAQCYRFDSNSLEADWMCDVCKSGEHAAEKSCRLCATKGGIIKQTVTGDYVHVLCALSLAGDEGKITISDKDRLDGQIDLSGIEKARWRLKCYLCGRGAAGAPIQCEAESCVRPFHMTCAKAYGLEISISLTGCNDGIGWCHLCPAGAHLRTKIKQSVNSNVHQPPIPAFLLWRLHAFLKKTTLTEEDRDGLIDAVCKRYEANRIRGAAVLTENADDDEMEDSTSADGDETLQSLPPVSQGLVIRQLKPDPYENLAKISPKRKTSHAPDSSAKRAKTIEYQNPVCPNKPRSVRTSSAKTEKERNTAAYRPASRSPSPSSMQLSRQRRRACPTCRSIACSGRTRRSNCHYFDPTTAKVEASPTKQRTKKAPKGSEIPDIPIPQSLPSQYGAVQDLGTSEFVNGSDSFAANTPTTAASFASTRSPAVSYSSVSSSSALSAAAIQPTQPATDFSFLSWFRDTWHLSSTNPSSQNPVHTSTESEVPSQAARVGPSADQELPNLKLPTTAFPNQSTDRPGSPNRESAKETTPSLLVPKAEDAADKQYTQNAPPLETIFFDWFPAARKSKQKDNFARLIRYLESQCGLELCLFADAGISKEDWHTMLGSAVDVVQIDGKIPDVVVLKLWSFYAELCKLADANEASPTEG